MEEQAKIDKAFVDGLRVELKARLDKKLMETLPIIKEKIGDASTKGVDVAIVYLTRLGVEKNDTFGELFIEHLTQYMKGIDVTVKVKYGVGGPYANFTWYKIAKSEQTGKPDSA